MSAEPALYAFRLDGASLELDERGLTRLADLVADQLAERGVAEPEPWLGVTEAAEYLACPMSRIYDLVAQRRVEFRKDGRRTLFRREWLDEALQRGG